MAAQMLSAAAVAKSITFTRPAPKDRFPPGAELRTEAPPARTGG
jgi:hypothetical protein